jgi:hypothetical protein
LIQGQLVVILIDSGSSNSFLNTQLAPQLAGISEIASPTKVQVDNGQVIQCQSELQQACWEIQGVKFISNFKHVPLPYYDVILGVDWLQTYNSMQIDWLNKWMVINFDGTSIQLQGIHPTLPAFSLVELLLVSEAASTYASPSLPAPIQQLL